MEEMIIMSINLHLFVIATTILLALYMIYASNKLENEVIYINRIKYLHPQYLVLVSAVAFTGIVIMAVNQFVLKPSLILMLVGVTIIIYTSIKKHIVRKNSNTNDEESMRELRTFVKKKHIGDIVIMLFVGIISFVLK